MVAHESYTNMIFFVWLACLFNRGGRQAAHWYTCCLLSAPPVKLRQTQPGTDIHIHLWDVQAYVSLSVRDCVCVSEWASVWVWERQIVRSVIRWFLRCNPTAVLRRCGSFHQRLPCLASWSLIHRLDLCRQTLYVCRRQHMASMSAAPSLPLLFSFCLSSSNLSVWYTLTYTLVEVCGFLFQMFWLCYPVWLFFSSVHTLEEPWSRVWLLNRACCVTIQHNTGLLIKFCRFLVGPTHIYIVVCLSQAHVTHKHNSVFGRCTYFH